MPFQTPCRCIVSESVSSLSLSQWVISLSGQVWNWANKRINYLSRYAFEWIYLFYECKIYQEIIITIIHTHNSHSATSNETYCASLSFFFHWNVTLVLYLKKKQKYSLIVKWGMEEVFQTVVKTIGKAIGAWCKRVAVCVHMLSPYLWRGDKKMTEARGSSQHRPSTLALTAPRYPCYPQYIIHTILNILSILSLTYYPYYP